MLLHNFYCYYFDLQGSVCNRRCLNANWNIHQQLIPIIYPKSLNSCHNSISTPTYYSLQYTSKPRKKKTEQQFFFLSQRMHLKMRFKQPKEETVPIEREKKKNKLIDVLVLRSFARFAFISFLRNTQLQCTNMLSQFCKQSKIVAHRQWYFDFGYVCLVSW